MPPSKILFVFGTRPEAIKLCPLFLHLQSYPALFEPRLCVTAQHRGLLDGMLERFGVRADHDLDVMRPNQSLSALTGRILEGLGPVLEAERPAMVIVQGDTTSTFAAALAAFYQRVAVGHVEAGLRTGDVSQPFPEEINRVLTTRLAALHFAPTPRAAANLRRDGVAEDRIHVTGNTCIDALLYTRGRLLSGEWPGYHGPLAASGRRLVLVTAHRRESFGEGFTHICEALRRLAAREDLEIVYPVHPNPNVLGVVERELKGVERIHLIEPLDYVPFVDLMRRADILLTDSGGVQEEGPSLGKPVLVMRDKTERQEALEAGTAQLVGTEPDRIVEAVAALMADPAALDSYAPRNPFGDGQACRRIREVLESHLAR